MDNFVVDTEFLHPLVSAWLEKLENARRSRSKWEEIADECVMFYSRSAAAMWRPDYNKRFWKGKIKPRFQISINKAFEWVALFAPRLLWEYPHRDVKPKKRLQLDASILQADPAIAMLVQQLAPLQVANESQAQVAAMCMDRWLNYTPQETPGGGLKGHAFRAVVDALLKGRGCLVSRRYTKPASQSNLTGSFYLSPNDLLTDPDAKSFEECKWIAIKHCEPHWEVERRFGLQDGYLKSKSTLESSWQAAELKTDDPHGVNRAAGRTNDTMVWWEIYSKMGPGTRMTKIDTDIRTHLENVVGDWAYIAISANCEFPLNCTTDMLRAGAGDDQVRKAFEWPVPLWADQRWPVTPLDFYTDPDSSWPLAPLAAGLGELKLLNFLIPWATARVWSSSRDFWAIAASQIEQYREYILNGDDQSIIPVPVGTDDVRKVISVMQQPESRQDLWRIIEFVMEMFDKRTGMTETAYGRNENGTQNRTAEETIAKNQAVGIRPDYMQQVVTDWLAQDAANEAFLARWFVQGEDVEPVLGPIGRALWENYVMSTDVNLIVRQMEYSVSAASIRRPNRDRDIGNFQNIMQYFMPTSTQYGFQTGDFSAYNYLVGKWAEFHDADMEGAMLNPLPPPAPPMTQDPNNPSRPEGPAVVDPQDPQAAMPQQQMQPPMPMDPMMDPSMQQTQPTGMEGLPPELLAALMAAQQPALSPQVPM